MNCPPLQKGRNFSFLPGTGIRRDGGAESQSVFSVLNIPGLNPKSLHSAHVVKACILLITICSSDGDYVPGSHLGAF